MSFKINRCQQININDRTNRITEREQRFLNNSWAKTYGDTIFPMIDEKKFSVLYCEDNGRPNTPVNVIVGSLFLKEMLQLTDEELFESIMFDIRYQYALQLTSFEEIPFSDRTVSRFRERLYLYESETKGDLLKEEIERLSKEFSKMLKISGSIKRMDSLMVSSSCKNMGRLELIYTCVSNLVKAIIKGGETEALPEHMIKYGEESNKNAYCYRMDKEEVSTRLEAVTADAIMLYEIAAELQSGANEFQLLERMLTDQVENGRLKENKKISPKSMQNPSDEDATFRRKAGKENQGYSGYIVEDCGENYNIITQYNYDVNVHSDSEFGKNAIKELGNQEEKIVMIGDGGFGGTENCKEAEDKGIELITTNLTGTKPPEIIKEFEIAEGVIKSCPEGHEPVDSKYKEEKKEYNAHFEKETCESCPKKNECPVVIQKKRAVVKITETTIIRVDLSEKLNSEEYKAYARKRNGVEGIPSVLRRRYRVDEMPVRGLIRTKMWFGCKIAAINIKRVIAATLNSFIFYIYLVFNGHKNYCSINFTSF